MEEKKHKGGYELLKEKYAKLEKERDEWKAKYVQADAAKQDAVDRYNRKQTDYATVTQAHSNALGKIDEQDLKLAFLLDHCPFWVRWMYRKHFEKGGN